MFRATAFAVVAALLSALVSLAVEWLTGRHLATWEMAVTFVSVVLALVFWEIATFRKRRARDRLLGMRDSALW